MEKRRKIFGVFIVSFLLLLACIKILSPYTALGKREVIRTPFTLGFQKEQFKLKRGESVQLRVNRLNVRVTYKSSNFRVAKVDNNGKVTAKKAGTAIIYGKIGDTIITCRIKVTD